MNHLVTNLHALKNLQSETIVYAVVVFLVAVAISFLVANLISYKGGNDRSYISRRIWFIIIGLFSSLGFFIYNDTVVKHNIKNVGWQNMFSSTNLECLAITLGGYIVLGVILMFVFRHSKYGSILGRDKKA